jgi:NTE family protein
MRVFATPGRSKTAFVLAGGGNIGAVQVGMMRALLEHGMGADLVVGSSVGAVSAADCAGNPTVEGLRELEAIWRRLRRTDILRLGWCGFLGILRRRDHLASSEGFRRLLQSHLGYRNLEDAALPVHVVDVLTGEAVVLSQGPVIEGVLASSGIPAAFAPIEFDSRLLFDGALATNTPIRAAVACGARGLIVLPTPPGAVLRIPPSGAIRTITLLTTQQLAGEIGRLDASIESHVLPTGRSPGVSPFDFSRTSELIERGYRSTKQWIDAGCMGCSPMSAAGWTPRQARSAVSGQTAVSTGDRTVRGQVFTDRPGSTFQKAWQRKLWFAAPARKYSRPQETRQRSGSLAARAVLASIRRASLTT